MIPDHVYNELPDANPLKEADKELFGVGSKDVLPVVGMFTADLQAVLLQKQPDGELRPVAYASRAMSGVEQRYAQIEKEQCQQRGQVSDTVTF